MEAEIQRFLLHWRPDGRLTKFGLLCIRLVVAINFGYSQ